MPALPSVAFTFGNSSTTTTNPVNFSIPVPSQASSACGKSEDHGTPGLEAVQVVDSEKMKRVREAYEKEERCKEQKERFELALEKVGRRNKGGKKADVKEDKIEEDKVCKPKGKGQGRMKFRNGQKGGLVEPGK